jgi:hypothetical protein
MKPGDSALAIYLNDHLAGSTVGLELARRAAENNRGTVYGTELEELRDDIAKDREALIDLMRRLSVGRDRLKVAAGWAAEKARRLKPNGNPLGYSAIARLEELEMLSLGVEGKLALWEALRHSHGDEPAVREAGLGGLAERAREQRRRLEELRQRAAIEAL